MSILDTSFRCNCSVTSALDIVGDKWTLVVIKLMLLEQKKTFKEFSQSDESIAPSILSNRLKTLLKIGFILLLIMAFTSCKSNKKAVSYQNPQAKAIEKDRISTPQEKDQFRQIVAMSDEVFDQLEESKPFSE